MAIEKHPWEVILRGLGAPVVIWHSAAEEEDALVLTYCNPAAVRILRFDEETVSGAPFHTVMPDASVMRLVGELHDTAREVLRRGEPREVRGVSIRFPGASLDCLHFNFLPLSQRDVAMVGESPYKGFLDCSSDVFGVVSPAGDTLYVTPSAATNFGFSREEVGEVMDTLVIDEPGLEALTTAWRHVVSHSGAVKTVEFRRQSREGHWRDMELIARDFCEVPEVGGVLINSRDISQRKADERRIVALNEDLEAFTYTVSHDLRLPLRLVSEILGRAEADGETSLSARIRSDLARAGDLVGDMTGLIADLLTFSRTGTAPLSRSQVDISGLAREVCDELVCSGAIDADDFHLQDELFGMADPVLLRQVLANLFGNAVKFTRSASPPRIVLTGHTSALGTTFLVQDNGVGFAPEQAAQLFTVFRRLHQDSAVPGSGVGLAIVKRIVERHGGEVWAEGAPGLGASFYVTLPGEGT